jgi:hypothetical protein
VNGREDFAQSSRALLELQLKLMREATTALAANSQRMQQDFDSMLHAFAMLPVAADRAIRSAASAPGSATAAGRARKTRSARHGSNEHAR